LLKEGIRLLSVFHYYYFDGFKIDVFGYNKETGRYVYSVETPYSSKVREPNPTTWQTSANISTSYHPEENAYGSSFTKQNHPQMEGGFLMLSATGCRGYFSISRFKAPLSAFNHGEYKHSPEQ